MPDNHKKDFDTKSRKATYFVLFALSILSALTILSLWLIPLMVVESSAAAGSGGLVWIGGVMTAQEILIAPATLLTIFVFRKLSQWLKLRKVHPVAGMIPVVINILAANVVVVFPLMSLLANMLGLLLSPSLTVTITSESFIKEADETSYVATIHAENNTGQEIYLPLALTDDTTAVGQDINDPDHVLMDNGIILPIGTSDRKVKMLNYYPYWICYQNVLAKPLHLVYSINVKQFEWSPLNRTINGVLPVKSTINESIRKLACSPKP